jgi:hypothetical protein
MQFMWNRWDFWVFWQVKKGLFLEVFGPKGSKIGFFGSFFGSFLVILAENRVFGLFWSILAYFGGFLYRNPIGNGFWSFWGFLVWESFGEIPEFSEIAISV